MYLEQHLLWKFEHNLSNDNSRYSYTIVFYLNIHAQQRYLSVTNFVMLQMMIIAKFV